MYAMHESTHQKMQVTQAPSSCYDELSDEFGHHSGCPLAEVGVVREENETIFGAELIPASMEDMVFKLNLQYQSHRPFVWGWHMVAWQELHQPLVERQASHAVLIGDRMQRLVVPIDTPVRLAVEVFAQYRDLKDGDPGVGLRSQPPQGRRDVFDVPLDARHPPNPFQPQEEPAYGGEGLGGHVVGADQENDDVGPALDDGIEAPQHVP